VAGEKMRAIGAGPRGLTAFDRADGSEDPTGLVAVTVNV